MANEAKDTIYVDIDDEITAVIDKVGSSSHKLVALVLPKRASVFQSIVNMKLLKRKSEEAGKNIVLVTTEGSLLPLAGAVGLHVAKTLASKPEIPEPPEKVANFVDADEDEPINLEDKAEDKLEDKKEEEPVDLKAMANEPVGKLSNKGKGKDVETIELDNEAIAKEDEENQAKEAEKAKKPKRDKLLKIPNFEKFRLWAFLGLAILLILIFLAVLLAKILPKATIDIKTDAQKLPTNVSLNLSTSAGSIDTGNNTIPAKQVNESKTYSVTVNTTGQQNAQAASGPITLTAASCHGSIPKVVPQGSTVTQGGYSYTTQSDADYTSTQISGSCIDYYGNTTIVANSAGSGFNTGANTSFSVDGPNQPNGVTLSGSGSTSGGANAAQVVAQADINNAVGKMATDTSGAKSDLDGQLSQSGYDAINVTFTAGNPDVSSNNPVGTAASSVMVTETVSYTLYGAKQSDLTTLLDNSIKSQLSGSQSILDTGLGTANFTVGSSATNINMQTSAVIGPNINVAQLKHKIAGDKTAQIQSIISANPNVTGVTVHFSPFFVSSAPSNVGKITINVSKPTTSK